MTEWQARIEAELEDLRARVEDLETPQPGQTWLTAHGDRCRVISIDGNSAIVEINTSQREVAVHSLLRKAPMDGWKNE